MASKSEVIQLRAKARSLNMNEGVNLFGYAADAFACGNERNALELLAQLEKACRQAGEFKRRATEMQAELGA